MNLTEKKKKQHDVLLKLPVGSDGEGLCVSLFDQH